VKYVLAVALAVAGLGAYWYFKAQWPAPLPALVVVLGLVAGAAVFLATTAKGRDTREFLAEARFELRKVVWPTRQEAVRTTWVVFIVVVLLSLLLAGFDFVIQKLVAWFLSLGR